MSFGRNIQNTLEFECFSYHVGLLVVKLSSLKLNTESNACKFIQLMHDFHHFRDEY